MMSAIRFPEFVPHPLLRNGHLQTIAGVYVPDRGFHHGAEPRVVDLDDGDRIVLHDDVPLRWQPGHRVALLLHGVAGCHRSPYMVRVAAKLNAAGVRTFRMDMRGCGAGFMLAQRPGHAGRSEDAAAAIQAIQQWCPDSCVTLIGFSMGGNIALKLAGEAGSSPPGGLDAVLAVAPPIDLTRCAANLETGLNPIYSKNFVGGLVRQVRQRRKFSPVLRGIPLNPRPRRLVEFDDRFTAPLSGFSGAHEYYERCSSIQLLRHIRLRSLILSASDDPVVPSEMFRDTQLADETELHLSKHGGHVGFVGISGVDPDRRWMDWRIVDWTLSLDTHAPAKLERCGSQ